MFVTAYSAAAHGILGYQVVVEVNTSNGEMGKIILVGLPDTAVRESTQRVTSAIANSQLFWPQGVVTINLAPADMRKEGPSFDLPIALAMIAAAQERRDPPEWSDACFVGELGLGGEVRPVKGALCLAMAARAAGRKRMFLPAENAGEAALVEGLEVFPVSTLRETWATLIGLHKIKPIPRRDPFTHGSREQKLDHDFADVKGQYAAKRAIEVAVAGGHNLVMVGPPGSGKSMLAKRIPTIMPPLTMEEALETTKIHSICGQLDPRTGLVTQRPFRSPHHTISDAGLLGGSQNPTPGEISLAHHGVLFLDELPEFRRNTLEVMRQPMEDSQVTISRAVGSMTFPSAFMLVAAMNPTPSGYFPGEPRCTDSQAAIEKYRARISGPLLDRIDIHIEVPALPVEELASRQPGESSAVIRERVARAREIQLARFHQDAVDRAVEIAADPTKADPPPGEPMEDYAAHPTHGAQHSASSNTINDPRFCNARMSPRQIRKYCQIDDASMALLKHAMSAYGLSARAHDRILKVARTIADLEGSPHIQSDHLSEAIQYRSLERKWS